MVAKGGSTVACTANPGREGYSHLLAIGRC